jgi:regulator of nucleoside diphosphate kinase
MKHANCIVTDADRCRLGALLATRDGQAWGRRRWRIELEALLEEARPIAASDAPEVLFTMNSRAELIDLESSASRTVTLVYPEELDLVPDGVSVFDPLGVALFGCQEGDVLQCPAKDCKRRMRVAKIVYQPERAGAWHL